MEPLHYKILKILAHQPQHRMHYSQLKKYFPDIPDRALCLIMTENLGYNVDYDTDLDENGDFLIALTEIGITAYHEKKYSDFINKRTLWLNRIVSFILGVLTTSTAGIITWLITSGTLSRLLHLG